MFRIASLTLAVLLLAVACGDDDGGLSEGEKELADALAASMLADDAVAGTLTSSEAARCFAEGMVAELGVERLAILGLTAETQSQAEAFEAMEPTEREGIIDVAIECTDPEALMAAELAASGLSSGSAACLAEEMGKSGFYRDAFVAGFAGREFDPETNPEYAGLFLEAATECLSAEELGPLFGG